MMYRVSRKKRRPFQRLGTLIAISILAGMLAGGAVGFMSAKSSNSSPSSTSAPTSKSFQ